MNEPDKESKEVNCSFCRKPGREVGPMCEGPNKVFICYECSRLCCKVLEEEAGCKLIEEDADLLGKPLPPYQAMRLRFTIRDLLWLTLTRFGCHYRVSVPLPSISKD